MVSRTVAALAGTIVACLPLVNAHGFVSGIVVNGKWYEGYIVNSFPYMSSPPPVIAWSTTATDLGFVAPDAYTSSDIVCHRGSTPAALTAAAPAGSTVTFQWTPVWPTSHHGPVITYMAKCPGDCSTVDKSSLQFFKIDQHGLIDDSTPPGNWATDQLIANNNSFSVTIPRSIPSGNYVMRHELIGLHSALNADGAQNYPQCINLAVSGGGSASPATEPATSFYHSNDPGILINIYQALSSYVIPGPALFSG